MKRPIAHLVGVGMYAPPRVMTNDEFATMGLETTDEWIYKRTGIRQRHVAGLLLLDLVSGHRDVALLGFLDVAGGKANGSNGHEGDGKSRVE